MLTNSEPNSLLRGVIEIVREAGLAAMVVYRSDDFGTVYKSDNSPLTLADKSANNIIVKGLQALTPNIPIISEESPEIIPPERGTLSTIWLVDPIDGTKEFIDKTDNFTVNVGLVKDGTPVLGVVYAPAKRLLYYGILGQGAWKQLDDKPREEISAKAIQRPKRIAVSRSHKNAATRGYLKGVGEHQLVELGSSLKLCYVADGTVDLYPRLGSSMEWDMAAADAVVRAAGGTVIAYDTKLPIAYNKADLHNPDFIASTGNS